MESQSTPVAAPPGQEEQNQPLPSHEELLAHRRTLKARRKAGEDVGDEWRSIQRQIRASRKARNQGSDEDDDTSDEPSGERFLLEAHLQRSLRENLHQLAPGLTVADNGTERTVAAGRIDILTRDADGACFASSS